VQFTNIWYQVISGLGWG